MDDIVFPDDDHRNWFTVLEIIGKGSFGEVFRAMDDRYILTEMRFDEKKEIPLNSHFDDSVKHLYDDEPNIAEFLRTDDSNELSKYLAQFTFTSLMDFSKKYIKFQQDPKSRIQVLESLVTYREKVKDVANGQKTKGLVPKAVRMNFSKRPMVALKKLLLTGIPQKDVQESILTSNHEVFALSQLSCMTPVYTELTAESYLKNPAKQMDNSSFLEYPPIGVASKTIEVIMPLVDYFEEPNVARYLCYPYANGGDCKKLLYDIWLRVKGANENTFCFMPPLCVWFLFYSMSKALMICEEGRIINTDIKLENILYDSRKGFYYLTDFGLACLTHNSKCNKTSGSPTMFPPESAINPVRYHSGDMWALGISIWEFALGRNYDINANTINELFGKIIGGDTPDMELLKAKMPDTWKGRDLLIWLLEHIFYGTPEERPKPREIMAKIETLFRPDVAKFKEPTTVESYLWFENRNLLNKFINIPPQHSDYIPTVFSKRRVVKPVEKNIVRNFVAYTLKGKNVLTRPLALGT